MTMATASRWTRRQRLVTGYTYSSGWVSAGSTRASRRRWRRLRGQAQPGGRRTSGHIPRRKRPGRWLRHRGGRRRQRPGHGLDTYSSGWVSGGHRHKLQRRLYDAFVAKLQPDRRAPLVDVPRRKRCRPWHTASRWTAAATFWSRATHIPPAGSPAGSTASFNGGFSDAFVAKLSPTGGHLWSTYLGGSSDDYGYGIAVDSGGNVLVTG